MKISQIIVGPRPSFIVKRAAEDLAGYLRGLYGFKVNVRATVRAGTGAILSLHNPGEAEKLGLSEQGYCLRPGPSNGRQIFQIIGGSSEAVAWGAYALAESWGVRYLLHRDVLPDDPTALRLPTAQEIHEPGMKLRGYRTYNDMYTPCKWPVSEFETLLTQLCKLRMNAIMFMQYPDDACFDLQWRGGKKNVAKTNYGFIVPLRDDAIGHEHFVKSGDAKFGRFTNPDLDHCKDYPTSIRKGRKYLEDICKLAHDRGIKVGVAVTSDLSWPIKKRLAELTDPDMFVEFKQTSDTKARHEELGLSTKIIRWATNISGCTDEMASAMSIRNPMFLDLQRSITRSYLSSFNCADYLILTTSEFRPSAADSQAAWDDLDHRYHLSRIATLDQILDECRKKAEITAERAEYELLADICMLWLYDYVINQSPPEHKSKDPQIIPARLSIELNRFLPSIFPESPFYISFPGYMPNYPLKRPDTFDAFTNSPLKGEMLVSLEDDNVGIVPQYSGPTIEAIAKLIYKKKMDGFVTRQFLHSKTFPAFFFLAHSAWDREFTLADSYEMLFGRLCGKAAMKPLNKALRLLGDLATKMHDDFESISFLSPRIASWFFPPMTPIAEPPTKMSDPKERRRQQHIADTYRKGAELLAQAEKLSKPAGKIILLPLTRQCEFGAQYITGFLHLRSASDLRLQMGAADAQNDVDTLVSLQDQFMESLDGVRKRYRAAVETWADCIEDRCDLTVLAHLNHYLSGAIEAVHHLASLENTWTRLPSRMAPKKQAVLVEA